MDGCQGTATKPGRLGSVLLSASPAEEETELSSQMHFRSLHGGGGKVPTRPKICRRSSHGLEVAWLALSVSGVQLCCGKPSSFSTVLLIAKNMMKPELNVFLCLITVSIINYSPMSEFNHISYSKGASFPLHGLGTQSLLGWWWISGLFHQLLPEHMGTSLLAPL